MLRVTEGLGDKIASNRRKGSFGDNSESIYALADAHIITMDVRNIGY